ncbi:MAG TPA: ABC transporter permease subunit [Aliidongia sp.]|uniref:ABC transporter permease n=1 Tax=Aliidongia sp. TaxID=1914230 RepID=UPI002DDCA9CD|nr:ABC transporter permease subunit [Aliidongia sp.]HEV2677067.1 ABC transporter permease subunit [Aliidongia sp.]
MSSVGTLRFAVIAIMVGLLELACRTGLIGPTVIIPPSAMVESLWQILAEGDLTTDILSTFGNVLAAAVLSVVVGFVAGLAIHPLPRLRGALEPLLASYYAIPTFMFYPLFIVFFGVGNRAIIAIAFLLAVVSMVTSTLTGLDRIPPILRKTAKMYRMNRVSTALLIELPATIPHLFTGIKLSVAYAFIGVIASEFILSGAGIGYSISYAYNNFNNRAMYGLMLLVVVAVTTVNMVLHSIDRRFQERSRR